MVLIIFQGVYLYQFEYILKNFSYLLFPTRHLDSTHSSLSSTPTGRHRNGTHVTQLSASLLLTAFPTFDLPLTPGTLTLIPPRLLKATSAGRAALHNHTPALPYLSTSLLQRLDSPVLHPSQEIRL